MMTATIDNFLNKTVSQFFGRTSTLTLPGKKLAEYALLKSYQVIFERNKSKKPLSTNIEIKHSSQISFGSSMSACKAQITNKPIEALFNTNNLNRHILLFTEKIENNFVHIEMHFHNDALFHFKFLFPEAPADLRISLMKQLLSTYKLANVDLTLHTIYDSQNNCIQIRDMNTFQMDYTWLNSPFFIQLIKEITKTNNRLLVDYHLTSAPIITQ